MIEDKNGINKVSVYWIFGNVVVAVLIIAAFIGMKLYVRYVNDYGFSYTMGSSSSSCSLSISEEKSWGEASHGFAYGIQYGAVMENKSGVELRDWVATVNVPEDCIINDCWNCEYTFENGVITFTPVIYNKVIEVDGTRDFGFIIYTNTKNNIQNFTIHFYKLIAVSDLGLYTVVIVLAFLTIFLDINYIVSEIRSRYAERKKKEYEGIIDQTFLTFANMIDAKDNYTRGHSQRVAYYSRELAKRMGYKADDQQNIFYIALLHDIGKIGTPDSILKKKGRLENDEREEIQKHVTIGGDILKNFSAIEGIADGARYHHERYDGKGYVEGIFGENIPEIARIICVADSFDAMTSNRCYRPSLTIEKVIEELKNCSGTQFDPQIVPHMLDMIDENIAPIDIDKTPIKFH